MYRVLVKPLKYFPSSGCGLKGCWGSSLKFAATERNEWHLRCCCVEQSFLFNLQCRTVARKVANKNARSMLLRNKCSLQQTDIFVKVTKKNLKRYFLHSKAWREQCSPVQRTCIGEFLYEKKRTFDESEKMQSEPFLPVRGARERWTDKMYFTCTCNKLVHKSRSRNICKQALLTEEKANHLLLLLITKNTRKFGQCFKSS